jgi:multisubunit Na+/H+ antiporter MnhB subunit
MTAVGMSNADAQQGHATLDLWVRRACALLVAAVAAYASYQHQRSFALRGGADMTSAELWPLSVDGLLVLATAGLMKPGRDDSRRARWSVWLAFLLGIVVSLAANIAAAPTLGWQAVLVAGWPPVALLLAVELLAHRPGRRHAGASETGAVGDGENETRVALVPIRDASRTVRHPTAEHVMWQHYQHAVSRGHTPTGAELDRIAGTNNYGRAVLKRWRNAGRIPAARGRGWAIHASSEQEKVPS